MVPSPEGTAEFRVFHPYLRDLSSGTLLPNARIVELFSGIALGWNPHGTRFAFWAGMLDVTLSILALIGGGVIMELFAPASPKVDSPVEAGVIEELQPGNAS